MLLTVIVIITGLIILTRLKCKSELINVTDTIEFIQQEADIDAYYMLCGLKSDGIKIDSNILLVSDLGEEILLKEYIKKNSPFLVFRYSETHCLSCVEEQLRIQSEFDLNNKNIRMLFLCDFSSRKKLNFFKKTNNIESDVLVLKDLKLDVDDLNEPYYFLLNDDYAIMNLFIPRISNASLTIEYLEFAVHRLSD